MSQREPEKGKHYVAHEPKFCKCRLCHAYFYADTIEEARAACHEHAKNEHPTWGDSTCFWPD